MADPMPWRTIETVIDRPLDEAYAYARRPEHVPLWAAGLAGSLHRHGEEWIARTPAGEARIRFNPANAYGVLDHWVTLPGRPVVYVPLRMIAAGRGTLVTFTLFRQPGMDDAMVERDAAAVVADLAALKRLLEDSR